MRVEKDLVVNAPVARVYELWTDFEHFPRFMHHVEAVQRTETNTLHWRATLGPRTVEWDAEIKALVPNRTVTWHSTSGADNAGAVTLAEQGNITEMHVVIEYSPGLLERLANLITQEMSRSVEQDLDRFKALAEGQDVETNPHAAERAGTVGSAVAQTGGGTAGSAPGYHYEESDPNAGYRPGQSRQDHQGAAVADSGGSAGGAEQTRLGAPVEGNGESSSPSAGGRPGSDRDEQDAADGSPATDRGGMRIATTPDSGGETDTDNPVSRVEVEGLGSDESPGEAVGSTSPQEVAAARSALSGEPTPASGITGPGSQAGAGTSGGTGNEPTTGAMPSGSGTMGGASPNDPTGGAGSTTVAEGALGPSLMTYEAGTDPNAVTPPSDPNPAAAAGGSELGSAPPTPAGAPGPPAPTADQAPGRAHETMSAAVPSSPGRAEMGQAGVEPPATPTGGPHSFAEPPAIGNPAAPGPASPAEDATQASSTSANYSGGTDGWGTEPPTSPGVTGWSPGPPTDSGGEVH